MLAIALAGGFGTRLGAEFKNTPKALIQIGNRTLLSRLLEKLERVEAISQVIVATNARYHAHFSAYVHDHPTSLDVMVHNNGVAHPSERLGAIGDLAEVITHYSIDEDIFVTASDGMFDFELTELFEAHTRYPSDWIVVQEVEDPSNLIGGSEVRFGARDAITLFREKPRAPTSIHGGLPMYIYRRETLSLVEVFLQEGQDPDSPGRFPEWLYTRQEMRGFEVDKSQVFHDLGTREALESFGLAQERTPPELGATE